LIGHSSTAFASQAPEATYSAGTGGGISRVFGRLSQGDHVKVPDERVRLTDLVTAAKAVAHATVRLCS
jgi:hypothetical protein